MKITKRLKAVLCAEGIRNVPTSELEAIGARGSGDLRQAINDLQLLALPLSHRARSAPRLNIAPGGGSETGGSDQRMSSLHVIAKLLHGNKPVGDDSAATTQRKRAKKRSREWEPESLMRSCDMGVDAVAAFVQHNCVEFFTDVDDLCAGLEVLSDADLFVARVFSSSHVSRRNVALLSC